MFQMFNRNLIIQRERRKEKGRDLTLKLQLFICLEVKQQIWKMKGGKKFISSSIVLEHYFIEVWLGAMFGN